MCTVTWLIEPGGYELFFNRDERKTREPARRPAVHETGGIHYICPVDGRAGGTWLGVNEHGVTLGMLNYYAAEHSVPEGRISRGLLLRSLFGCGDTEAALGKARAGDLAAYSPFILIALEPGKELRTLVWDGVDAIEGAQPEPCFLTTSSYASGKVVASRRRLFQDLERDRAPLTRADLLAFHASRFPEPGPFAVCMEREDAQTLSLSHIVVTPERVQFAYADGPPCRTPLDPPLDLPRARKA